MNDNLMRERDRAIRKLGLDDLTGKGEKQDRERKRREIEEKRRAVRGFKESHR
jgi:hypothetical protein